MEEPSAANYTANWANNQSNLARNGFRNAFHNDPKAVAAYTVSKGK
jgi:hypothetical protein